MDSSKIENLIDHHRWLLNNGVMPDAVKNQLFMYGSIVHKDVIAVDLAIDATNKHLSYDIYVSSNLIKKIQKFNRLKKSNTLFNLWRFKRILRKEGNLNFYGILSKFIKDYCGNSWTTKVKVTDYALYKPDYSNDVENKLFIADR